MEPVEIEVMSLQYTGKLSIEPLDMELSVFDVYMQDNLLGKARPVKVRGEVRWYSHEIKDKELLAQIGEWIEYQFVLTEDSFKNIYEFKFLNWRIFTIWWKLQESVANLSKVAELKLHR